MAPPAARAKARINMSFERGERASWEIERGAGGGVRFGLAFAGGGVSTGLPGFCSNYRFPRKLRLFYCHLALAGNIRKEIGRLYLSGIGRLHLGEIGRLDLDGIGRLYRADLALMNLF